MICTSWERIRRNMSRPRRRRRTCDRSDDSRRRTSPPGSCFPRNTGLRMTARRVRCTCRGCRPVRPGMSRMKQGRRSHPQSFRIRVRGRRTKRARMGRSPVGCHLRRRMPRRRQRPSLPAADGRPASWKHLLHAEEIAFAAGSFPGFRPTGKIDKNRQFAR